MLHSVQRSAWPLARIITWDKHQVYTIVRISQDANLKKSKTPSLSREHICVSLPEHKQLNSNIAVSENIHSHGQIEGSSCGESCFQTRLDLGASVESLRCQHVTQCFTCDNYKLTSTFGRSSWASTQCLETDVQLCFSCRVDLHHLLFRQGRASI